MTKVVLVVVGGASSWTVCGGWFLIILCTFLLVIVKACFFSPPRRPWPSPLPVLTESPQQGGVRCGGGGCAALCGGPCGGCFCGCLWFCFWFFFRIKMVTCFFFLFFLFFSFPFRYDEWVKADKIIRPANKNVPKIKHRKKIKVCVCLFLSVC